MRGNLELKAVTKSGRYQYIGFFFEMTDNVEMDGDEVISKELGTQIVVFMNDENEKFYVRNTDIVGADIENPYGQFQPYLSSFTSWLTLTINNEDKYEVSK